MSSPEGPLNPEPSPDPSPAPNPDPKPGRALKYRRIADDLRRGIEHGEYRPGGALPGENDLMARYRVARMTVRQALAELQREGLAVARRGSGVYVSGAAGTGPGGGLREDPSADLSADPGCAVAHGAADALRRESRTLVVVYAGEVARHLTTMAGACGYGCVLVEPDPARAAGAAAWADRVVAAIGGAAADAGTDIVVTDHHRADLGVVLRDALAGPARWVGLLGNPRDPGPHRELLAELGVAAADIDRVRRPIGLNIGSRTPPEIAVSTLAGLLADRAGKPGGFVF